MDLKRIKTSKNTKTATCTSDFLLHSRERARDVIPFGGNPGTFLGQRRNIDTIEDSFNLLFDDEMFHLLQRETNIHIKSKLEKLHAQKEHLFESSKFPYLLETSP